MPSPRTAPRQRASRCCQTAQWRGPPTCRHARAGCRPPPHTLHTPWPAHQPSSPPHTVALPFLLLCTSLPLQATFFQPMRLQNFPSDSWDLLIDLEFAGGRGAGCHAVAAMGVCCGVKTSP